MSQITCQCPRCQQQFTVQPEEIGQPTICTSCGHKFTIREKATAARILGLINCVTWLLPIIGIPVGIVGLVLGCRKKNTIAIVLNAITLGAAVVNSIIGAILGAQGKLF